MSIDTLYTTKSEYVFKLLKDRILTNVLEPGSELKISEISKEFNISTIPVREALKALESEGLVEMEPHKSAKVATFSLEKLKQITTVRAGLEGYAARLAVRYVNDIDLTKLNELLEQMETAAESNDSEDFSAKNLDFHRYLYKIPPFPMLYDMIISVWDGGKWTRAVFSTSPERMKASIKEHYDILEAIKEVNEDKVEQLVREHRMRAGHDLEESACLRDRK